MNGTKIVCGIPSLMPLDIDPEGAHPAHALEAPMSISLHIGRRWRGTSDVRRY